MDRPNVDESLLKGDLRDIQRVNRWFGAYRLIRSESEIFFSHWFSTEHKPLQPCNILDLCTGSGDIPRVIVDWCRKRKITVHITATDFNSRILTQAKQESEGYPEITFEVVNALQPPLPDQSYDWVMCNLALHHFSTEQAVRILKNMWRIARVAILVNDLYRSRIFSGLAKTFIPLLSFNPILRFDAYLSTRRAFTWDEMLRLAFHADIPSPQLRRYFLGRQVLVAQKFIS